MIRELPILLEPTDVAQILSGEQTQIRVPFGRDHLAYVERLVGDGRLTKDVLTDVPTMSDQDREYLEDLSPFGQWGDRLYGREEWDFRPWSVRPDGSETIMVAYKADGHQEERYPPMGWRPGNFNARRWIPNIYMPKWVSRISLAVESVEIRRLQDMNEADAEACGVRRVVDYGQIHFQWVAPRGSAASARYVTARRAYQMGWSEIYGADRWRENRWAWVVHFKRLGESILAVAV